MYGTLVFILALCCLSEFGIGREAEESSAGINENNGTFTYSIRNIVKMINKIVLLHKPKILTKIRKCIWKWCSSIFILQPHHIFLLQNYA